MVLSWNIKQIVKKKYVVSSKDKKDWMDFTKNLKNIYNIKIDYLEFRNEKDLEISNFKKKNRLFVAYNIDKIRLIDNF